MGQTMKAAAAIRFGAPLEVREVPIPRVGPHQILVKVNACGVCHTDLHTARGDWPVKPTLPRVPGHEAIGVVAEAGEAVTTVKVGQRVGVAWLHKACRHCEHCLSGWETLCESQTRTGYDVDGGFAEYMLAAPNFVGWIPDQLSDVAAAPLICAGVTVFKGLLMLDANVGDWVVVSGIGGLGHLALQYAKVMGYKVIAVDIEDSKLDLAAKLGADMTLNAREVDPASYLRREIGGAHGVLVTAVGRSAFAQAVEMLRPGGTVALNGLPPGDFPLDIFNVVMRGLTIRGSIVGTRMDLARSLQLAADGGVKATVHTAKLDDINDVFEHLENWPVEGRIVLDMSLR